MVEYLNTKSSDQGQYTPAGQLAKGMEVVALGDYEGVRRGMRGRILDLGRVVHWVLWANGDKLPIRFNLVRKV